MRRIFTIFAALLLALPFSKASADDDVTDLTNSAKPVATAPAEVTAPDTQPGHVIDALGTMKDRPPAQSRQGTLTLNDGTQISGLIWTTLDTPLRVWIEETKTYQDLDLAALKRLDVHVLTAQMEDDWRWLKEGSDKKIFSGKKYPNVELAYRFTLVSGQTLEGGVVAPIYIQTADKRLTLALYKKYKGKLDQTLADLVYIRSIEFTDTPSPATSAKTTRLPLIY